LTIVANRRLHKGKNISFDQYASIINEWGCPQRSGLGWKAAVENPSKLGSLSHGDASLA
jgi:hypothetical protein